jgi:hypothetical protein
VSTHGKVGAGVPHAFEPLLPIPSLLLCCASAVIGGMMGAAPKRGTGVKGLFFRDERFSLSPPLTREHVGKKMMATTVFYRYTARL